MTVAIKTTTRSYGISKIITSGHTYDVTGTYDIDHLQTEFNSSCIVTMWEKRNLPMRTLSIKVETRCKLADRIEYMSWFEKEEYHPKDYHDLGEIFAQM